MKLVVFGASGLTGREVVRHAQGQEHIVTAFVRDRSTFRIVPHVNIAEGDVREIDSVFHAMSGQEAVVLALGSRTLGGSDLLKVGSANIIAAMRRQGVRRLIALGAAGAISGAAKKHSAAGQILFSVLTRTLLRNVLRDHGEMEAQIAVSGLDYTIVRPARLTNGAENGNCRAETGGLPARWRPIARSDVAIFMLKQLTDAAYLQRGVYISR